MKKINLPPPQEKKITPAAKRPVSEEEEGVCSGAEGPTAHALRRS